MEKIDDFDIFKDSLIRYCGEYIQPNTLLSQRWNILFLLCRIINGNVYLNEHEYTYITI